MEQFAVLYCFRNFDFEPRNIYDTVSALTAAAAYFTIGISLNYKIAVFIETTLSILQCDFNDAVVWSSKT